MAPVIAKKHLHQTGALRLFQKYCLVLKSVKATVDDVVRLSSSEISTGAVILLLKEKQDTEEGTLPHSCVESMDGVEGRSTKTNCAINIYLHFLFNY